MNRRNYQREMEETLKALGELRKRLRLLLHSCCAPCSSYVLETLCPYFDITIFYFNPNIGEEEEYARRAEEQRRLAACLDVPGDVAYLEGEYCPQRYYEAVCGLEGLPEGGERCFRCYALRLTETARAAREGGFDFFTTTLSISPLKNADKLNEIGQALEAQWGVRYLCSDFKKKEGYKRSIELSRLYGLYRQDYCGCVFSKAESLRRRERKD